MYSELNLAFQTSVHMAHIRLTRLSVNRHIFPLNVSTYGKQLVFAWNMMWLSLKLKNKLRWILTKTLNSTTKMSRSINEKITEIEHGKIRNSMNKHAIRLYDIPHGGLNKWSNHRE